MDHKLKFELILSASGVAFTNSVGKALKGVNAFQRELRGAKKAANNLDAGLATMAGKFSALVGGISMGVLGKEIWDASVATEKLNSAFSAIYGSSERAKEELAFIKTLSNELGQEYRVLADSYRMIAAAAKGTALEGEGTRKFLQAFTETATTLGATSDQVYRAFLQIGQGISRSRFELEDLKTIAEALPGVSFKDFAESLGVTTEEFFKMVSAGEIVADDFLPKLSKALHEKFGDAAKAASQNAQQALNRMKNSWFELKNAIGKAGFMDLATGKINDLAAAMNNPEVKERITELAENFFKLADAVLEFTMEHAEMLGKVAVGAVALSALSRTVFLLTRIFNGLNAAMLTTTGMRLIPYLASVTTSLKAVNIAAMSTATAMGAAAGATLALIGGYKAGEWLTMHKYWSAIEDQTKANAVANKELAQRYREVSRATGLTITSMKELDQAVEDGKIHYDEVAGAWVKGSEKITGAVKTSAGAQKQLTKEALDAMKQEYQKYTDEIIRLQEKIANKEQSLAERLRSMSRSGMSDFSAWKDRKKEAQEYEAAADKASKAGDFEEAIKLYGKAEDAYADLNKEVKEGEKTLVTSQEGVKSAMEGVNRVGNSTIEVFKKQTEAAEKTREAVDKEAGGALSRSLEEAKNGVDNISKATVDMGDSMVDQINRFGVAAAEEFDLIEKYLNSPHKMVIEIEKIEKNRLGGMIGAVQGLNTGGFPRRPSGKLSGYGGGDKIKALLEAGEFIVRKEAVSKYGAAFFHALNSMQMNSIPTVQARIGGLIHSAKQTSIQRFKEGGMPAPVNTSSNTQSTPISYDSTVRIDLGIIPGKPPVTAFAKKEAAREMIRQFEEMARNAA